jgi:hypothetical protein
LFRQPIHDNGAVAAILVTVDEGRRLLSRILRLCRLFTGHHR